MDLQATPAAEHLQLYIWILVPVVIGLVTLVGWFLNKIVDKIVGAFETMIQAVKDLENAFASFKAEFIAVKAKVEIEGPTTKTRLNDHSRRLTNHEKRIGRIETQHNILHPNCKLPNEREVDESPQVYPEAQ